MIHRAAWQTLLSMSICVAGMTNLKWTSGGSFFGLWPADIVRVALRLWAFVQS
jgi:hypothetical protein